MKKNAEKEHTARPSSEKEKKTGRSIGTMDLILIIVGVSLVAFTIKMIMVFETYAAVPDTLITCVFAALAGECGIMGWIKTTKDRYKDREWKKEDEQQTRESDSSEDGRDPNER